MPCMHFSNLKSNTKMKINTKTAHVPDAENGRGARISSLGPAPPPHLPRGRPRPTLPS